MKIATFNVNSINARLPRITGWIDDTKPDVVVLQEIKCVDEKFPATEFEDRGYNVEVHGQKSYNGVALLSKYPVDDVVKGLPGDDSGRTSSLHRGAGDARGRRARCVLAGFTCPMAIRRPARNMIISSAGWSA